MRYNCAKTWEWHIFVEHGRKRISAWIIRPWIGQSHVRQSNRIAKRHILSEPGKSQHHLPVCKRTPCCAHRRPAVALWIPGQSDPGKELIPPFTLHLLSAFILGVAGKEQPGRCMDIHAAPQTCIEKLLIEMAEPTVLAGPWKIGLPSDTVVHREPRRQFPGVLRVNTNNVRTI